MKPAYNQLHRHILMLLAGLLLGACSTAPVQQGDQIIPPAFEADRVLGSDVTTLSEQISDPWQGFNRTMYRFNYRFDKYVFLPAVNAYQFITPDFLETGIHNFFTNIRNITTLINSILQLSGEKSLETTGRFLVNSTIGLLGFVDVATALDIPKHQEDFGQTLGHWGVGSGPYLVLPILGPSNVRDGIGKGVDRVVFTEIRDRATDLETWQEWTWDILDAVDTRAHTAFRYYETGSPFEYEWVKVLYTTKRRLDIEK